MGTPQSLTAQDLKRLLQHGAIETSPPPSVSLLSWYFFGNTEENNEKFLSYFIRYVSRNLNPGSP